MLPRRPARAGRPSRNALLTDAFLRLRGAREHNLAGFDLEIPRGKLTVVTGVSGSGKSSLAFDTLLREGQRRFLELMPSYARQFAGGFRRPDLLGAEGLGPAVAVAQDVASSNPRSTVGTVTEVHDLLRLLFARLGEAPAGVRPTRGLFSWNGEGACPACRGLGLEDRLDPARFTRVHRSAIVRLDRIDALLREAGGDYTLRLKSGRQLPVSRSRVDALERWMGLSGAKA